QLSLNCGCRRKRRPARPQPMQWKDLLEGLGLAAMQVRRVIVDTEQRRHVEPIPPKRRAGGGVVADLQRIGDIERPNILEIFDGKGVASEREEFVRRCCRYRGRRREPGDAGVQGRTVLADGAGVVAMKYLALRPLGSPMAGSAISLADRRTGR